MSTKEDKRRDIASAARDLFANYGFRAVSMDRIAEKAVVAKGTLYLYFKDKESLFEYLIDEFLEEFNEILLEIQSSGLSLIDEIVEVLYRLLFFRKSQKFIYRIITEAKELKTPISMGGVEKIDAFLARYIEKRLLAFDDESRLKSEVISFVVIKSYSALAFEWEENHEPLDEGLITETIRVILKGWLGQR